MRFLVVLALAGIAVAQTTNYQMKSINADKKGYYSAKTTYPHFVNLGKTGDLANTEISNWTKSAQAAWVKSAAKNPQAPRVSYEYLATPTVHRNDLRVISLYFTVYEFTGGAHGNTNFVCMNFSQAHGQIRKLTIGDLFVPGFDYKRQLSDQILAQLQGVERAAWVAGAEVVEIKPAQLENFTIHKDGLYFLFPPYELGPYSSGTFKVLVPYTKLMEHLNKGVLFAR